MPIITEYTKPEFIKILKTNDKMEMIDELAAVFSGSGITGDVASLVRALKEREEVMSTGIGFGIAIPHAKIPAVNEMAFAIGISPRGIPYDSMDGEPVHIVILVAAGERQHKEYLRLLSKILSFIKKDRVKDAIINSRSSEDVVAILKASH